MGGFGGQASVRPLNNVLVNSVDRMFANFVEGWLDAADNVPATARRLIRRQYGDSEEMAALIQALGQLQPVLDARAPQDYAEAVERANTSLWDAAEQQRLAIYELANAYDGGAAATQLLAAATQNRYQTELALLAQIDAAAKEIDATYGRSIETIRLSLMGEEERYNYYRDQAHELQDLLGTLTDPAAIRGTALEIERLTSSAYGLLGTDEQRQESGEEFIDFLESVQARAQTQLEGSRTLVEEQASAIREAITQAMRDVAAELQNAGLTQQEAADKLESAAQTWLEAVQTPITLDFTKGDTEVGY